MSDVFKFPNGGYDVTVCRKKEVIDELNLSTEDKEIMLAIVTQCENDAINFLKEGRWTGIPYLGNMKIPDHRIMFKEIGGSEILEDAKKELDAQRYKAFRKDFNASIKISVNRDRLYRYITSCFVTKHKKIYNRFLRSNKVGKLTDKYCYARFMCYSLTELKGCIHTE
jgi:hypothetical protein